MAGLVLGAAAPAVGARARSTARGAAAPKAAYRMPTHSGLKANPLAMARDRVATLGDKVHASLAVAGGSGKGARSVATMMPIGVPRVPYKTPNENSWQWVDIWNCLYRERIVWVGQTIDEELGNQLVATMLYLDSIEKGGKDIYLYINTEGGDVVPTMAILDTMGYIKSDVGCVGFGSARAMGGMLLANGAKGKRAALPNTCIMLHHPAGVARGSASDIHNEGKELLKIRAKINKMVSRATGQPRRRCTKTFAAISTSPRSRRWTTASSTRCSTRGADRGD